MMRCNSYYGGYRTRTFADIFPSFEDFSAEHEASALPNRLSSPVSLETIYYLLYARYGNSHICNSDENQFKYRLWSNIFMYGPIWEKQIDLQQKLVALTDDEVRKGSGAIYNHAYNPGGTPSTATLEEIPTLDDQNTVHYKKSKLEAYTMLSGVLDSDITTIFLNRFKSLFIKVFAPDYPLLYVEEEE